MNAPSVPCEENAYLADHLTILRQSYRHWTRRDLADPCLNDAEAARYLFHAPFALVSHTAGEDPLFNYANQTALSLFGMNWEEITTCPSRLSAEHADQEARGRLLSEVAARGYVGDYRGVRIGRHGRRFEIEGAVIWNLLDVQGKSCGQAAYFQRWRWV